MIKIKVYELLKNNKINIDEDLFYYGWSTLKYYIIYLLMTLPILYYCHTLHYSIFFLIFYIPLRRYIGGFHFSNNLICLLFSSLITIITPIIAYTYKIHLFISFLIFILLGIITYFIVPIDHPNKRISANEKKVYKKKAIKIELLYLSIFSVLFILSKNIYANLLCIINLISLISITISYIQYR